MEPYRLVYVCPRKLYVNIFRQGRFQGLDGKGFKINKKGLQNIELDWSNGTSSALKGKKNGASVILSGKHGPDKISVRSDVQ